jgi:hypothetical protein
MITEEIEAFGGIGELKEKYPSFFGDAVGRMGKAHIQCEH